MYHFHFICYFYCLFLYYFNSIFHSQAIMANQVARVAGTIFTGVCIFLGWIVAYIIQVITIAVMYPVSTPSQRADVCGHIFRRVNYFTASLANPLWSTVILRPFPEVKSEKFVVAMNHLSNADPWLCIGPLLPRDCKWVCKGSLFSVPFGGWCLANAGDLKVEFTSDKGGWGTKKGSVRSMMDQAKACLQRNQPIAVYPEGVRNYNPNGPLNEFKLGFFMLAVETEATVVPVALSGSEKCWPRGSWMFDAATVYVSCGDPISAVGHTAESLRDKVQEQVAKLRDSHPDRVATK